MNPTRDRTVARARRPLLLGVILLMTAAVMTAARGGEPADRRRAELIRMAKRESW